ncbi:uncharacterized protein LOC114960880 [Acropora millepora]|uniref:uncharacterized protein LOC114960880 n=1 Tax=Acropora millepora TaxID=45264 RepID=UPI001CF5E868|nr:uncharacterized protein LOC114960880 [Acropora millepora]
MFSSHDATDLRMAMKVTTEAVKLLFPDVSNISTDKLLRLMNTEDSEVILLDVRSEEEFKVSHLSKALLVNPETGDMEELMKLITEKGETAEEPITVVCYCSVGYRSSALAQKLHNELEKHGNQELKSKLVILNLEGSIFKWANEGKELEDHKGARTLFVHPYNMVWGRLLNSELRSYEPRDSHQ